MVRMKLPVEKKLLKQCLAQDKKAWDAFVDQYSRLITHAIAQTLARYSFAHSEQVIPDLFNSVFVSLIEDNCRKLRQFDWKCKLSSWLHLIAVRVTIDYLRKQSPVPSLNGDAESEQVLKDTITNGNPLPDAVVELEEEKRLLRQITESLTAKERLFVELCYIRELPASDIAAFLKTTENNVYQIKNRIKHKMIKIAGKWV